MRVRMKTGILSICFSLLFFLALLNGAAIPGEPAEIGRLVNEYRMLLDAGKLKGVEVTRAEELGKKSKRAFDNRDPAKAKELLKEAIALLKGAEGKASKSPPQERPVLSSRQGRAEVLKPFDSPFGFLMTVIAERPLPPGIQSPPGIDTIKDLRETGAKWVRYDRIFVWDRIERKRGVYDWSIPDYVVRETYESGINILATVMAFNKLDGAARGYAPKDLKWFSEFLIKCVERYDGDGVDDAPGSPVISYWQLGNEIDNPIYYKDTPNNYVEFLKTASQAIRQANPDAKIVIGSLANPGGISYHEKVLAGLKDGRYFDLFDFHWYAEGGDTYRKHAIDKMEFDELVSRLKKLLSKNGYKDIPLWITEAGDYTVEPKHPKKKFPLHSEQDQAASLFKLYTYSLAHGVSKVFWTSLTDLSGYEGISGGYFDNIGLINNPRGSGKSGKKLSYYTFKKLAETLEGYGPENVSALKEDGIKVYRFEKGGKTVYAVWQDEGAGENVFKISAINSPRVRIIDAVPVLKDGAPVFDSEVIETRDGSITYRFSRKTPVIMLAE